MGNSWNDMGWRKRQKARHELVKKHFEHLNSCSNKEDCMRIALKVAMLALAYPRDCPPMNQVLERLALQLVDSKDERDLEFILKLFAELKAAEIAERQLAVILSESQH